VTPTTHQSKRQKTSEITTGFRPPIRFMKLPCVAIRPHWITIIGFLQISIELVTLLITPVPTRSADGSAHDARVRLGESDGGPRARIGPVWLSRVQRSPPGVAYHC
jgi:hypothetical protein